MFFAKTLVSLPASSSTIDCVINAVCDDKRQTFRYCLRHESEVFTAAATKLRILRILRSTMRAIHE